MSKPCLMIYADASPLMGTGHAMRCLALAQAWQDRGGCVCWLAREMPEPILRRIQSENIELCLYENDSDPEQNAATLNRLEQKYSVWVTVVDGYHLNYESFWKNRLSTVPVLWIDDLGGRVPEGVRWVLNQNLYADREMYDSGADMTVGYLLGSRYSLLRREFYPQRNAEKRKGVTGMSGSNILITFGGADPVNMTGYILGVVNDLAKDTNVDVLVGAANPRAEEYKTFINCSSGQFRMYCDVSTMSDFIERAALVIGPTGSSHLEFIRHGKYAVYFTLAENGERVAESIKDLGLGVAFDLGVRPEKAELSSLFEDIRQDKKTTMVQTYGSDLVDGMGAFRVVDELLGKALAFRSADESDRVRLLAWANDPAVRQASFSQKVIKAEEHKHWLKQRLIDPQSTLWIVLEEGAPKGVIRWQRDDKGIVVVSVSLASGSRGNGMGKKTIALGCQRYFGEKPATLRIEAYIKADNKASKMAFQHAGFVTSKHVQIEGWNAECLVLDNPGGNVYADRNT